jgi:hypothetical protein
LLRGIEEGLLLGYTLFPGITSYANGACIAVIGKVAEI